MATTVAQLAKQVAATDAKLDKIIGALSQQNAPAKNAPAKGKGKNAPAKQQDERGASRSQVYKAFFDLFEVVYGDRLTGWPTSSDIEVILTDLADKLA